MSQLQEQSLSLVRSSASLVMLCCIFLLVLTPSPYPSFKKKAWSLRQNLNAHTELFALQHKTTTVFSLLSVLVKIIYTTTFLHIIQYYTRECRRCRAVGREDPYGVCGLKLVYYRRVQSSTLLLSPSAACVAPQRLEGGLWLSSSWPRPRKVAAAVSAFSL